MTETALGQLRIAIRRAYSGLPCRDCNIGFNSIAGLILWSSLGVHLTDGVSQVEAMS